MDIVLFLSIFSTFFDWSRFCHTIVLLRTALIVPHRFAECLRTAFLIFFAHSCSCLLVQIPLCFQPSWHNHLLWRRKKILLQLLYLLVLGCGRFTIVRLGNKMIALFEHFDLGIRILHFRLREFADFLAEEHLRYFFLRLPKVVANVDVDILVWADELVHC